MILIYKREIRSILNLSMSLRVTEWAMIYVTSPAQLTYPVQQEDPGYERIEMATEKMRTVELKQTVSEKFFDEEVFISSTTV